MSIKRLIPEADWYFHDDATIYEMAVLDVIDVMDAAK